MFHWSVGAIKATHTNLFTFTADYIFVLRTRRSVHVLAYSLGLGNTIIYILWKSIPVCLLSIWNPTLVSKAIRLSAIKIQWILLWHIRQGFSVSELWMVREDSWGGTCLPILESHLLTFINLIKINGKMTIITYNYYDCFYKSPEVGIKKSNSDLIFYKSTWLIIFV